MNFNKILTQLNHVDLQNQIIDHKFMTNHTYRTKYKHDQTKNYGEVRLPHQSLQFSHNNNNLLKKTKHRYFEDVEQDEIEDANIFGYSTFDYFCDFKKKSIQFNQSSKLMMSKHIRKPQLHQKKIKSTKNSGQSQYQDYVDQGTCLNRPKTAIVSRGTPTKRKVHHKLSLNQIEKAATCGNPLSACMKQHYFTEQIFNFNPSQNPDPKIYNIRCGSRTETFYKQFHPRSSKNQNKKSDYYFQNQSQKHQKRHLVFQQTMTKFYPNKNEEKKLAKSRSRHLDRENINKQKSIFTKQIQEHFDHLTKRGQVPNGGIIIKMDDLKYVVYEKQANNRKENQEIAYYTQSIKDKTLAPRCPSYDPSKTVVINGQKHINIVDYSPYRKISRQTSRMHQQQQFLMEPQLLQSPILSTLKPSACLSIYRSINAFLLQRGQLPNLEFKYDKNYTPLSYSTFNKLLSSSIKNHCTDEVSDCRSNLLKHFSQKSFSQMPKSKENVYTIWMVDCMTLDWVIFQSVELMQEGFAYKGSGLCPLAMAQTIMTNCLPSHFVHLIITRKPQKQNNSIDSTSQLLVYQTFIHNSDITYFQGHQVKIQYFKYFFKRFISFDPNIHKKQQVLSSVSLVFKTEAKTPVEFEEFCSEMKIKDNMNILALKNMHARDHGVSFRSVEIRLSKLLADANETLMMVKKELIEGYDWRGVSLAKSKKQQRGYHMEHFYI